MAFLYGRAGRLTAQNGGFRPGQRHEGLYLFPRLHPSARMSQVDLAAVNHTAFPRFAAAATEALEVVLGPGDMLYIPPYWFHHVTAASDEPAVSASVHTESDAARVRDRMLLHELPIRDAWSKPERASALLTYVDALFPDPAARRDFVGRMVRSRWDPLPNDAAENSPGLAEQLARCAPCPPGSTASAAPKGPQRTTAYRTALVA